MSLIFFRSYYSAKSRQICKLSTYNKQFNSLFLQNKSSNLILNLKQIASQGVMYYDLPFDAKEEIIKQIRYYFNTNEGNTYGNTINSNNNDNISLTEKKLSNIPLLIYNLSKIKFRYQYLPLDYRKKLDREIMRNYNIYSSIDRAILIHGLGMISTEWLMLKPLTQVCIVDMITKSIDKLSPQAMADIIHGMGMMNIQWNLMPKEYHQCVIRCLQLIYGSLHQSNSSIATSASVTAAADAISIKSSIIASIFYGLARSGCRWNELDKSLKKYLMLALIYTTSQISHHEISNIFFAMGAMNISWYFVSNDYKAVIKRMLAKCYQTNEISRQMKPTIIANILYGLGECDCYWHEMDEEMRKYILNGIHYALPDINMPKFSTIICGLGKMEVPWEIMSIHYKHNIAKCLIKYMNRKKMIDYPMSLVTARIFYGLSKSHCNWEELERMVIELSPRKEDDDDGVRQVQLSLRSCAHDLIGDMWDDISYEWRHTILRSFDPPIIINNSN